MAQTDKQTEGHGDSVKTNKVHRQVGKHKKETLGECFNDGLLTDPLQPGRYRVTVTES